MEGRDMAGKRGRGLFDYAPPVCHRGEKQRVLQAALQGLNNTSEWGRGLQKGQGKGAAGSWEREKGSRS